MSNTYPGCVPDAARLARKIGAASLAVTVLLFSSACQSDPWSAMPHTMGCKLMADTPNRNNATQVTPLDPIRVVQVRFAHLGSERLEMSVEFVAPPQIPLFGYNISVGDEDRHIQITPPINPDLGMDWMANRADKAPYDSVLEAVTVKGRFINFVLDFKGNEDFLHSPFRPTVWFQNQRFGADVDYNGQKCDWDSPVAGSGSLSPAAKDAAVNKPETQLHWRFRSPTGNIVCDLDGTTGLGTAECEVRQHTYQPQLSRDCPAFWVNSMILKQGKEVTFSCSPRSRFEDGLPQQGYGNPLTVGEITCVLNRDTGVRCEDATTGHYFQLSRQAYQWR